ncbi:MAG: carboxypeptidase-like regulatory domain-containing protein [Myxococcales bacterium]|nr:carboxypeptidase-like regulatory domain-containing protein [Myxococcales bacterium]
MNSPLARAALVATVAVALAIGCNSEKVRSKTADINPAETAAQAAEPADATRPQARNASETVKAGDFKKPDTPLIASISTRTLRPGTIDVEKFEIVGQLKQQAPQLGAPIKGATIYVDTATRGAEKVQSDDNGMFRVSVTYGEFRRLRIEAPGFVGEERSRDTLIGWLSKSAERRTKEEVVYLSPGIEVEGTVVADNKPITDVSVRCVSHGLHGNPRLAASGVTDGTGSFRVGCPRERVKLLAVHPGYQHGVTDWIDLNQSPDAKPQIKLRRGARLSGRVLGADGHPLSQATLYISDPDAPAVLHRWEEWRLYLEPGPFWRLSESDGSFDYGPVSGRLEIRAEANGATGGVTLDAKGFDDIYVEIAVR